MIVRARTYLRQRRRRNYFQVRLALGGGPVSEGRRDEPHSERRAPALAAFCPGDDGDCDGCVLDLMRGGWDGHDGRVLDSDSSSYQNKREEIVCRCK